MDEELWERFTKIIRRHLRDDDTILNDVDLITVVFARFMKDRARPIIDVNE